MASDVESADSPDAEPSARSAASELASKARGLVAEVQGCASWSHECRAAVLAALDDAARSLAAAKAPVLVAHERSESWRAPGVRSFEDAYGKDTRAGYGSARAETGDAHVLTSLEGGPEALARGELTQEHVRRLRPRVDKLPASDRAELLTGAGAEHLLKLARENDAPTFARKVENVIAASSAAKAQASREAIRARRHLSLRESPEGTHLSGLLDPVAGHTLRLALEAATPVPAGDDERTRDQRNADAVAAIARHALDDGAFKPGAPVRPHLTLVMGEETFARAGAHMRHASHVDPARAGVRPEGETETGADDDAAHTALLSTPPVVRLDDGPVLDPASLARILCTSDVTRLVVDAEAMPLDVGRTQRIFSGHLRRAVVARDVGCAWSGCGMPAQFCEVHHMDWWDDDHGHTSVDRGVLLCEFHHHELHRLDLDIVRDGQPPPGSLKPGEPGYEPPRYRTVPRSTTRRERAAARHRRLRRGIEDARARATAQRRRNEHSIADSRARQPGATPGVGPTPASPPSVRTVG